MAILATGTDHLMCALYCHQTTDTSSPSPGIQLHHHVPGDYSLKRARLEAYDDIHQHRSPSPERAFTPRPVVPDRFAQHAAAYHSLTDPSPLLYGPRPPCLMENHPSAHHPHLDVSAAAFPLPLGRPSLPSLQSPPVAPSYPPGTAVPIRRSFAPDQSPPSPRLIPSDSSTPNGALGTIGSPPFLDPASFQESWYHDLVPSQGLTDVVPRGNRSKASFPDQQSSPSILPPMPRGLKRGPFQDVNLRRQTAQTREIGSCIRCRMQRIRCESNPDVLSGPCLTCQRLAGLSSARFPCLRYKITDIKLYHPGEIPSNEWTRRWNNNTVDPIHNWASGEIKVVRISEGLCNKYIELPVREFIPQPGDKLDLTWDCGGTKRSIRLPPYALVNLEDGIKAYGNYIPGVIGHALKKLSGPHDGLLYLTYRQACQIFKDPATPTKSLELLDSMFMLWMSTRLSTMPACIVGEETLGIDQYLLNDAHPGQGGIPLPPALSAQLEFILIHTIQKRLRKDVLNRLQKMIYRGNRGTWLRPFAREDRVKEYHLGANILLAHFHYCSRSFCPLSDDCKDQTLRAQLDLDDDKIHFIKQSRAFAKQYESDWAKLRKLNVYENDYFFVSQLFEENWQPRSPK
ncbi:hypothetical protein TOPH_03259 [Tolypocladium ophioglossoides CBS 100239]|uniref:Zn(2)-C6 fungal-type domain-containing protein n=1 Tax=Tolypocladium ophioglossoides (strain CBS 100239) TaxID=1163406 RepID=A0A0L0ND91_TOLOC|nr:hypothetical protein TOPH_03259 [Tolypocladium ophioglossoides CBS 100239]